MRRALLAGAAAVAGALALRRRSGAGLPGRVDLRDPYNDAPAVPASGAADETPRPL